MDISKIRKKAKAKEAGPLPAEAPEVRRAGETAPNAEEEFAAAAPVSASEGEAGAVESMERAEEKTPEGAENSGTEAPEDIMMELLTFSLASEEFAFRLSEVEEIIRYQNITTVPLTSDYVLGITSLRGKIIPVIDLKRRLVMKMLDAGPVSGTESSLEGQDRAGEKTEKILIISGPQGFIGASIEKVMGVVRLRKDQVLGPPAHLTESERRYVEGVVILEKRFISIVRAEEALRIDAS